MASSKQFLLNHAECREWGRKIQQRKRRETKQEPSSLAGCAWLLSFLSLSGAKAYGRGHTLYFHTNFGNAGRGVIHLSPASQHTCDISSPSIDRIGHGGTYHATQVLLGGRARARAAFAIIIQCQSVRLRPRVRRHCTVASLRPPFRKCYPLVRE